jgi:hypothetical protein
MVMPGIDNIKDKKFRSMTLSELEAATCDRQISHMVIRGDIPPNLDQLVPHLTALRLERISDKHQLQR